MVLGHNNKVIRFLFVMAKYVWKDSQVTIRISLTLILLIIPVISIALIVGL